ncbi:putative uncharacterized protein DDB_G0291608 [Chironomus tepperi]|uniref:putative uncharacterized protein DDB_G0291608 n=1 Tax=Chironomus tepperi TaxID=113505 RepID=UPI00391FB022
MKNCAILLLLCVLHIAYANDELTLEIESDELMKTGDLEHAETKDASATEIIKQIRKLNPDGTFTIGFEADDGSFKIETRDLEGNVKQGTYGYIDEHGEVKRVSYSTQNNTIFKDYKPPQLQQQTTSIKAVVNEETEENETISPASSLRYNRTFVSTTRRPSALAYLTSTTNPSTKSSVVQTIPKLPKRRISISEPNIQQSLLSTETSKLPIEGTTTVIYATSVPTPKPYLSRSTTSPNYSSLNNKKAVSAVTEKGVEIDQIERKVFIATSKDVTTMKPILSKEKNDEKLELIKRGNTLRRQLKPDDEAQEAQQQILYGDGDESSAIYGSSFGNVRPLFTTTSQPKIPLQVLAARQRATQLQSILANSSPGTTTTTTTERIYTKAPKRQSKVKAVEEAKENEGILTQAPSLVEQIPATQSTEPLNDRRAFQRQLPPNLEGLYRPRNYLRQMQFQPQPQAQELPVNRYGQPAVPQQQQQQQIPNGINPFYPEQQQQQQLQQQPSDLFPGQFPPFYPQRNPYDYDRPLTVRDFERLLQILVVRQQQQPYRVNPYYPSTNPLAYPPFIPNYNQPYSQIPRPPYFNPLQSGLFDPGFQNPYYSSSMPISQHLNGGAQAADTMIPQGGRLPFIPQQQQQQQQQEQQQIDPNQDSQRFSRRRQYNSRYYGQQQTQVPSPPISPEQEINYNLLQGPVTDNNQLPPSVREQLLYRMLMLALRSEGGPPPPSPYPQQPHQQYQPSSLASSASSVHTVLEPEQEETSTIIKSTESSSSKKPVRSVQILGEEKESEEN